jgi:hypothetical protein
MCFRALLDLVRDEPEYSAAFLPHYKVISLYLKQSRKESNEHVFLFVLLTVSMNLKKYSRFRYIKYQNLDAGYTKIIFSFQERCDIAVIMYPLDINNIYFIKFILYRVSILLRKEVKNYLHSCFFHFIYAKVGVEQVRHFSA